MWLYARKVSEEEAEWLTGVPVAEAIHNPDKVCEIEVVLDAGS